MLIRCPQCQYANHVEADTTKPRIVCARCATIIPIEYLANYSVPPLSNLAGEGQNQSEPLFMKTPESPLDLDSLLNTPTEAASDQSMPFFGSPIIQTPPQATENHWDNEEILDIPRASALTAPSQESPLAIEDLLSATPVQEEVMEPLAQYFEPETTNVTGQDLQPEIGTYESAVHTAANEETEDKILEEDLPFAAAAPPEFSSELSEDVLAEVATQEPPPQFSPRPSVFAQDSYVRSANSTYVMATPSPGAKGRLAKVFLAAALAFALLGVGYFALSGLVKDWLGLRQQQTAANQPPPSASGATVNGGKPEAASSAGTTAGSNKNTSAGAAASPAAAATSSTQPTSAPTVANQNASNKPTPTPAPTQAGSSGHAVGSGEGSLAIQVASYKSSGEAQQTVTRLKSAGVEARIVKADVPGKGTWFRVQAGRFTNEAEASKYASELRAKGVARDFIVTGYQNQ